MHVIAPKTGSPLAVVVASFPASNQVADRKRRVPNYLPKAIGGERCDFTR
jgi:hypothetical protein